MNGTVVTLFEVVLYALIILVVANSLLSWFPVRRDNQFAVFLDRATQPLLAPFRRIMPRTGMIDFTGLVVVLLLTLMITAVRRTAAL